MRYEVIGSLVEHQQDWHFRGVNYRQFVTYKLVVRFANGEERCFYGHGTAWTTASAERQAKYRAYESLNDYRRNHK